MEIIAIILLVGIFGVLKSLLSRYANAGWAGLRQIYKYDSRQYQGKKLFFRRSILRNLSVSKDTWANDPVDRFFLIVGDTDFTRILGANKTGLYLQEPSYLFSSVLIPWKEINTSASKGGWPGWIQFSFLKAQNMLLFVPEDIASTLLELSDGGLSRNW